MIHRAASAAFGYKKMLVVPPVGLEPTHLAVPLSLLTPSPGFAGISP